MDDQFLYQTRPPVRAEFGEGLLEHLNAQRTWIDRLRSTAANGRHAMLRPVLLLLALGTAGLAVWQGIEYFWERRGEFWVHEGDIQCLQVHWGDLQTSDMNPPSQASQLPQYIAVSGALAMLNYEVSLPTWAPEGLALREAIPPPATRDQAIFLYWDRAAGGTGVVLMASPSGYLPEALAPPGAVEFVDLGDRSGMLVRGSCGFPGPELLQGLEPGSLYQTEWDPSRPWLTWKDGEVAYRLMGLEPLVTAEDLVRMAESAR